MKKTIKQQPASKSYGCQQAIRMDKTLLARIRTFQERIRKDTGIEVSLASATRTLIEKGLDAAR